MTKLQHTFRIWSTKYIRNFLTFYLKWTTESWRLRKRNKRKSKNNAKFKNASNCRNRDKNRRKPWTNRCRKWRTWRRKFIRWDNRATIWSTPSDRQLTFSAACKRNSPKWSKTLWNSSKWTSKCTTISWKYSQTTWQKEQYLEFSNFSFSSLECNNFNSFINKSQWNLTNDK